MKRLGFKRLKGRKLFYFSFGDLLRTTVIFSTALLMCFLLQRLGESDSYSPLIFQLAVFLTARYTQGYFYGITATVAAVVCVNYLFTEPYWTFNFSRTGYPINFGAMIVVSLLTSTMTTRIKRHEQLSTQIKLENMRANLLRAISHDIRTPLTSIIGAAEYMISDREQPLSAHQRALAGEIRSDGQWLLRIAENLLSITRAGSGATIHKELEVAEEIIGESAAKFIKRYPESHVNVSAPEEVLMVPMDALLIEQVIINLLENAALHGKGLTEITLRLRRNGENAIFEVEDDGAGIAPESLPYLFQGGPNTAQGADRTEKRSMGIGLSVCRTIVRAHGGELTGENRAEGGARFTFNLPLEGAMKDEQHEGKNSDR